MLITLPMTVMSGPELSGNIAMKRTRDMYFAELWKEHSTPPNNVNTHSQWIPGRSHEEKAKAQRTVLTRGMQEYR